MKDQIALLKNARLFSQFSDKECKSVIKTAKTRDFNQGDVIVKEGDVGGVGFYLVLDGEVDVVKGGEKLAALGKGEFFGEIAVLLEKDTPRSADVVANQPTKCMIVSRWDLRGLLRSHPDMAIKMLGAMALRFSNTHMKLSENAANVPLDGEE